MLSVHVTINSLRATADQLSMHSSTRSTTDSSALTLDRPDSLASTSIEIDRHASFIYLNNITLRQYLTDLTWFDCNPARSQSSNMLLSVCFECIKRSRLQAMSCHIPTKRKEQKSERTIS